MTPCVATCLSPVSSSPRLPGGCWMTRWQSAFPCPVSPACSTTTAPRRPASRSPTPPTIASSPFVLTTRSRQGWYGSSRNLLQAKRNRVRLKQWAEGAGRPCDRVTWLLLLKSSSSLEKVHSLSIGSAALPTLLSTSPRLLHAAGVRRDPRVRRGVTKVWYHLEANGPTSPLSSFSIGGKWEGSAKVPPTPSIFRVEFRTRI